MRLLALTFLVIGNLVANHAHAGDVSPQPLTRAGCDEAGMAWNENTNVCVANSNDVLFMPKSEVTNNVGQPLTRKECDAADMAWNDNGNVCGEKSEGSATNPVAPTMLISIDKTRQRMTVVLDGVKLYEWPVSTGRAGYSTPSGTYTANSMHKIWYSKEWDNAPMPHAVFFTGQGHAIHGTNEVKRLGNPASHGCVRISPRNATTLYALVAKNGLENTQVILAGLTPGGEDKLASPVRSKSPYRSAAYRSFKPDNNYSADVNGQPRGRRGLFGRLFGAP